MFGVDATSTRDAAGLKHAGVHFVCRYLSPTAWKNLSAGEARELEAAGIAIVTVYESTGQTVKGGRVAGVRDAKLAKSQLLLLKAPKNAPVYFAVDYDAGPGDQPAIDAYLRGAASVLGHERVGIYAGFGPVSRALDLGACRWAWQTYAWSGGKWDKRAHIHQYRNAQKLNGLDVDFDAAMFANYGQWRPPVIPKPKPAPSYTIDVYQGKKIVKVIATRFPGAALVRYGVARHKPSKITITRLAPDSLGDFPKIGA